MSGPVAIAGNVEAAIPSLDRTRSLDPTSFIDKQRLSTSTNGEVSQSFSGARGYLVRDISLFNGDSYSGQLRGNLPEGFGKYVWADGRVYEGNWRRGMRHGIGKITWPSGAIYEGAFSGGYIHGEGTYMLFEKLTYKGRWRLNLKHGLGYQSYANGDVFEGYWMQGLPEGPGKYTWANGNIYMGNMKGGKMSGKGTLTWSNGDSFEGSWLNGMMHGFGVYTWSDGGSYVGTWTRGLKDGKGSFYPKGSRVPPAQELYLKAMRKRGLLPDMKKQNRAHIRPGSSMDIGNVKFGGEWNSGQNLEQSRYRNVSLERRWSMEVSIEKVIGHDPSLGLSESLLDDLDEDSERSIPILEREYMQGVLINELVLDNKFSPSSRRATRRQKKLVREAKRIGEAIIKGHRSYDLMLSLQLGIRYTVGKITPIQKREVRASDFGPRASFWMNFPKTGSQLTPPHRSDDFRWKDYCPMVFRNLREMFEIDAADYMISICGNDALKELSSPGKSGSVFFLSQDDRFMIKTLRKSEVKGKIVYTYVNPPPILASWEALCATELILLLKVLLRMLPNYYRHVQSYDNTLITKFFGLHRIEPSSGQKFRFVVMGNMFCTELRIHRRFDLKGSSLGRSADNVEIDENTILKDLDLNVGFYLEPSWREALMRQIKIDAEFLEMENIMDYSLLLGVHYRAPQHLRPVRTSSRHLSADGLEILTEDDTLDDENYPQGLVLAPRGSNDGSVVVGSHIRGSRLRTSSASGNKEVDLLLPGTARLQIQLGVNMPARAEQISGKEDKEMYHPQVYDVVLYFGIIDILQEYNMSKKIEHAYKSLQFDSLSISAVDPTFYSERFRKFMLKVFPPSAVDN